MRRDEEPPARGAGELHACCAVMAPQPATCRRRQAKQVHPQHPVGSHISSMGTPLVSGSRKKMNRVIITTNPAKNRKKPHSCEGRMRAGATVSAMHAQLEREAALRWATAAVAYTARRAEPAERAAGQHARQGSVHSGAACTAGQHAQRTIAQSMDRNHCMVSMGCEGCALKRVRGSCNG